MLDGINHTISLADQKFQQRFETNKFPPAKFGHPEHIRLAYIYLCEYNPAAACHKMQKSLLTFLTAQKAVSQYHKTMTYAWTTAVNHFMTRSKKIDKSFVSFIGRNQKLLDSTIMLTHYSKQVLFSDKARSVFFEPDLHSIPA